MNTGNIVAITGIAGSGKSTISQLFARKGYYVIDCFKIEQNILKNSFCKSELIDLLGIDILDAYKNIIKNKIYYFGENQEIAKEIDQIIQKYIYKEILILSGKAFEDGKEVVFIDSSCVFGYPLEEYCDKIIIVTSPLVRHYERLAKRDKIAIEEAKEIVDKNNNQNYLIPKADYFISNTSLHDLHRQGEFVLKCVLNDIKYCKKRK